MYELPDETFEEDPPLGWIAVTVKEALSSASVSSVRTSFDEPFVAVVVSFTSTESVSSTATGVSLTPVTVIINVAVSVAVPSETV